MTAGPQLDESPDRRVKEQRKKKLKIKPLTQLLELPKSEKDLIVNSIGHTSISIANLVRYLFDIPYTRNDGTRVSTSQIFEMR